MVDLSTIRKEDIVIFQYDSRTLNNYWLASARWNDRYAKRHNHTFVYYTSNVDCKHGDEKLASPWCKVKAMLKVQVDFPNAFLFIYLDSDAVINRKYFLTSVNDFLKLMQKKLNWNPDERPLVFNQGVLRIC